jgi:hypothetical protein
LPLPRPPFPFLLQEQQKAALKHIEKRLKKTDSSVAERVVDILKDIGNSKKIEGKSG